MQTASSAPFSFDFFLGRSKRDLLVFLSFPYERSRRRICLFAPRKAANLDFEARVPVPFSIFPSSYKDKEAEPANTVHKHSELQVSLPHHHHAGREGHHSAHEQHQQFQRYKEEEVRVTREEERQHRPGIRKEIREEIITERRHRRPQSTFTETRVDIDEPPNRYDTPIDLIEREYRSRSTSPPSRVGSYAGSAAGRSSHSHSSTSLTLHRPHLHRPHLHHYHHHRPHKETTVVDEVTVNYPSRRHSISQAPSRVSEAIETTVDVPSQELALYRPQRPEIPDDIVEQTSYAPKTTMPYYDDMEKEGAEVIETRTFLESETVTIPTHHIRIGDILILQGRPCQVIRISTSSATGQHRYLGVDLFTKQLHEESSSVTNPAPSVVVQTMRGPIFKQYRVLDIADGVVVAMTETGDVKQGLPVIDQSNLWSRLKKSFESGRGSLRILVVSDHGREMAVDMKVVHGSRL